MKNFLSQLHTWVSIILSTIWVIAMINLWKWNTTETGLWFAFAMVLLGVAVLIASLLLADKNSIIGKFVNKLKSLFKK